MKELIALFLIYLVFFLYSIILYRKSFYIQKKIVYLLIPVYLVTIYLYFELVHYIDILLMENEIYFGFGHASIMLVLLFILAYLTAFVFIILYFIQKRKRTIDK